MATKAKPKSRPAPIGVPGPRLLATLRGWWRGEQKEPGDWLEVETGRDMAAWFDFIQQRIKARSHPSSDPNHDQTNVEAWLRDLTREVKRALIPRYSDGNMRAAACLGMILTTWFMQISRAKCYDPARPVEGRRQSMRVRMHYALWLFRLTVLDEEMIVDLVPGQTWDAPFAEDATDGTFV